MSAIGTLNEGSLHASLKERYAQPGDALEVPNGGFVIDIMRNRGAPDELLIEIQTGSFKAMGKKLDHLLGMHRMLLVYPIARRTVLERDGARRASPKKGSVFSLFEELVSIPTLLDHPSLELDVVLVDVTKHQVHDPKVRRGRGGWRTIDRHLDDVVESHRFSCMDDLWKLVGPLPDLFTTADIAASADIDRACAQRMAYCFRAADLIVQVDRIAAGNVYRMA